MEYINVGIIETLLMSIYNYKNNGAIYDNLDVILMANEVNMSNYLNPLYKLSELASHTYDDYHYKINNRFFDVFVYRDEKLSKNELFQLIICNNHLRITKFDQENYDRTVHNVANFEIPGTVYSFYDGAVIIIESDNEVLDNQYKTIK